MKDIIDVSDFPENISLLSLWLLFFNDILLNSCTQLVQYVDPRVLFSSLK